MQTQKSVDVRLTALGTRFRPLCLDVILSDYVSGGPACQQLWAARLMPFCLSLTVTICPRVANQVSKLTIWIIFWSLSAVQ